MVDELIKWLESALALAETLRFCTQNKSAKLQVTICNSDVSWLSSTATGVPETELSARMYTLAWYVCNSIITLCIISVSLLHYALCTS